MQTSPVVPAIVFALLLVGGCAAVFLVGAISHSGPLPNIAGVIVGASLTAFGIRAIQAPTSMQLNSSHGTDAFGQRRWASGGRSTTATEGTVVGIILVLIGLPLIVLGVFVGLMG